MNKSQILATAFCALATAALAPAASAQSVAINTAPTFAGQWEGEAEREPWPLFMLLQIEQGSSGAGGKALILGQTMPIERVEQSGEAVTITLGAGREPIVLTGRIQDGGFTGRLRQGTADFPLKLRPVPVYPKPADRLQAWGQDLDTLATRFIRADRSFSPGERAMFLEAIEAIRSDLPRLNDAQITARMAAAIALADNGHTRLYLLRNRQELRRLPVRLWWFSDGLYVVRATTEHQRLLGCKVDDIGGWTARIARDMAAPLFAGTPYWKDYKTVYSLTSPETLHGVGITPDVESAEFGLSGCAAAGRHRLLPLPLNKSREPVEAWWDLSPRFQSPGPGWTQVLQANSRPLPLYLRNGANYWFDYLPESGILYFQYNRSEQAKGESTSAFGERLLAELEQRKPRAFVLDLRFNTGGNLTLAEKLMDELVRRTQGMKRFVITGRATFSAGMSAAVPWRRPDVTFVGEPIGEVLDYWSEGGNIPLPNSGFDAHFANGLHSYSPARCPAGVPCRDLSVESLDPHVPVTASFADYRAGRDPAMEAILARIRSRR